ncbi:MAG: ATP-binding protein [Candidatus Hermodarchaeota archaeon]
MSDPNSSKDDLKTSSEIKEDSNDSDQINSTPISKEEVLSIQNSSQDDHQDKNKIKNDESDLKEGVFGWIGNKMYQDKVSEEELILNLEKRFVGAIFGKQGSGKTYTANVILEEILKMQASSDIPISTVVIDPMGVYFSLKFPNTIGECQTDVFELAPQGFKSHVRVLIPEGTQDRMDKIEYDGTIALRSSQVSLDEWSVAFDLGLENSILGALEAVIERLKAQENYSLDDMLNLLSNDDFLKKERITTQTVSDLHNRLHRAKGWGIFNEEGLDLSQVFASDKITVIDVSEVQFEGLTQLLTAMLADKAYRLRSSITRKVALAQTTGELPDISESEWLPPILLVIEEAHNFLPKRKSRTESSNALERYIKEGRSAGCSVLLVDRQPGALNVDALTQLDFVIVHNLTHETDLAAIKKIYPSDQSFDIRELKTLTPGMAAFLPSQERAQKMDIQETVYLKVRPRHSKHIARTERPEAALKESDQVEEDHVEEIEIACTEQSCPVSIEDLDDILQIQHILIIHKISGISIVSRGTGFAVEDQLISGFITAMTGVLDEARKTPKAQKRVAFKEFRYEIGEEGMVIWIAEGSLSVVALLLKTAASNMLKQRLKDFTLAFEEQFSNALENFMGNINPFQDVDRLLEAFLGTGLLAPMRINDKFQFSAIENDEELSQILQLFKTNQETLSSQEGLYFEEFIPFAIRSLRRVTWESLLDNILKAIQKQIICPLDPNIRNFVKTSEDKPSSKVILPLEPLTEPETESVMIPTYEGEKNSIDIEQELQIDSLSAIVPISEQITEIESSAMIEELPNHLAAVLTQVSSMSPPKPPPHLVEDILLREVTYGNWRKVFTSFRSEILQTLDEVGQLFRGLLAYGYEPLSETQKNSFKGPIVIFQRINTTTNYTEKKLLSICQLKSKSIIVIIGEQKK